jgi:hypothetical protein
METTDKIISSFRSWTRFLAIRLLPGVCIYLCVNELAVGQTFEFPGFPASTLPPKLSATTGLTLPLPTG